jgi:hypothetical protein
MFLNDVWRLFRVLPRGTSAGRLGARSSTTNARTFSVLAGKHFRVPSLENCRLASAFSTANEDYKLVSKEAHERFETEGYDPMSFLDQQIAWGDQDTFQYVSSFEETRSIRLNFKF